ncbi:nitrile hydratase accessory protein [Patulibacter defluvii]|uniref:nitrile hydratase accessory protein n=1 Tax=Patulibacter defluvii TaxID=3095358 RepID=UPI002A74D017|nr:nitrile hydratase accessory protein [Patulibacter sp. DM4]
MSAADAIRDEATLPRANGELVFEQPWQARAFSVAVAMTEAGRWRWDDFRARLIDEIGAWEREAGRADGGPVEPWDYYARWTAALEAVLCERGLIDPAELDAAQARIAHEAAHEHDHEHDGDHAH